MGKGSPDLPAYKEMKDTPWITQGREIAKKGGEGVLANYNNVNVFDDATKKSLQQRVDDMYSRSLSDFERNYRNTMQRYADKNYQQFGTLNATPAAYRTDMENLQQQRKLADLAYDKAMTYDTVVDKELNRRYNTLNMFNNMYQYGNVPYQQDVRNWEIRNKNLDRQYYNDLANSQPIFSFGGASGGALSGASTGAMIGNVVPGIGTALGAGLGALGGATLGGFGNA